jgi:hypothetical protein
MQRNQAVYVFWAMFWQSLWVAALTSFIWAMVVFPPQDKGAWMFLLFFVIAECLILLFSLSEANLPGKAISQGWALNEIIGSFERIEREIDGILGQIGEIDRTARVRAAFAYSREILSRLRTDAVTQKPVN